MKNHDSDKKILIIILHEYKDFFNEKLYKCKCKILQNGRDRSNIKSQFSTIKSRLFIAKEQIKFQNQNLIFDENFNVSKKDLSLETLDKSMRNQFLKNYWNWNKIYLKKTMQNIEKMKNELIEMVVA